jgi:hypothetical protein
VVVVGKDDSAAVVARGYFQGRSFDSSAAADSPGLTAAGLYLWLPTLSTEKSGKDGARSYEAGTGKNHRWIFRIQSPMSRPSHTLIAAQSIAMPNPDQSAHPYSGRTKCRVTEAAHDGVP